MSEYVNFLEDIKRFEQKWGEAPGWAYERLKLLEGTKKQ